MTDGYSLPRPLHVSSVENNTNTDDTNGTQVMSNPAKVCPHKYRHFGAHALETTTLVFMSFDHLRCPTLQLFYGLLLCCFAGMFSRAMRPALQLGFAHQWFKLASPTPRPRTCLGPGFSPALVPSLRPQVGVGRGRGFPCSCSLSSPSGGRCEGPSIAKALVPSLHISSP